MKLYREVTAMDEILKEWVCTLCGSILETPELERMIFSIIPQLRENTSCEDCGAPHTMFLLNERLRSAAKSQEITQELLISRIDLMRTVNEFADRAKPERKRSRASRRILYQALCGN